MSKINLFQTLDSFYSRVDSLNQPNSKDIANFKKKFYETREAVNALQIRTQEAVNLWKTLPSSFNSEAAEITDLNKIHQRAKLIKYAAIAVQFLAGAVAIIGLISLVASATYLSSALLCIGAAGIIIGISSERVNEMIGISTKTNSQLLTKALHLYSQNIALGLNYFEVIRQNRAVRSENFREFVNKFVNTTSYTVHDNARTNGDLHRLYLNFKYDLKALLLKN